jgi:hypothetical protein
MLTKILRYPLPEQLRLMLEILDDPADARSYALCKPSLGAFNFYERWLIGRALKKNQRHRALIEIMDVALGTSKQEESRFWGPSMVTATTQNKSSILTRDEMARQTTSLLNSCFDQEFHKAINAKVTRQLQK